MRLSLTLLGGFRAQLASGSGLTLPTKKTEALLAYLAVRPGQAQPRDKLAALLWGERAEEQARASLRQSISALRKALAVTVPPSLLVEGNTLALSPSAVDVDVAAFERLVAGGSAETLEQAAALYHGELLEGLTLREAPFEEWLLSERERLRELALEALAKLLAHQRAAGSTEQAIQTALRLLALDPLQESVHRTLMRLYARVGRRGTGLRQYQVCVAVLQRELGVEPEVETKELYQELLQQRVCPAPRSEAPPLHAARRPPPEPSPAGPELGTAQLPLIGREPELARLRESLEEAWRGSGQTVAVLGEAGIGKSRLVEALAAAAVQGGGRVLLGRAYETGQVLPFGPWAEALRTGLGSPWREELEGLSPVWRAELARLLPELGESGVQMATAAEDYLRLFEAAVRLMRHLAARKPLLLILEDLHWADEMSLRLLSFLGRRGLTWRLLVVATAREEELADAPLLRHVLVELTREQRLVHLTLSPLSQPETANLVRALARAGSAHASLARLAEVVWAVSEGNPFMVVETMRALEEGGMPQAPGIVPLPQRVRTVIAGRLERLSARGRELVAAAAVIGRQFDFALLQRAAGLAEREVAEGVEELVRRRVLSGAGEQFDFTHDRIREVSYSELLWPRRKLLHGMVARALEELYADELEQHFPALAEHYRQAGRPEQAIQYVLLAGEVAARRYAYADARAQYQNARTIAQTLPSSPQTFRSHIDATLKLASIALTREHFERDLANLPDAQILAERLHDGSRLAQVLYWLGRTHYVLGRQDAGIEYAQRALEVAEGLEDERVLAPPVNLLGRAYFVRGEYERACELLARSIRQMNALDNRIEEATAAGMLALCHALLGEFRPALAAADRGVRVAEAVEHLPTLAACLQYRAQVEAWRGECGAALRDYQKALELAEQSGDVFRRYLIHGNRGLAYLLAGEYRRAEEELDETVGMARQLGTRFFLGYYEGYLAEARLRRGDAGEAVRLSREALQIATESNQPWSQSVASRALAQALWLGVPPDYQGAEEAIKNAIAIQQARGMKFELAWSMVVYGHILEAKGELRGAREPLIRASEMFQHMGMASDLERARAAVQGVDATLCRVGGPGSG
ncbi:MAG: AAA family ATPase [Candidatus Methylomirabilia bacterium]